MDLRERLEALHERNSEPLPNAPPSNDEERKERFLELLSDGLTPPEAAKACERTATWFRRRRSPASVHYDGDFAEMYERIMDPEGEHRAALIDRARSALAKAAEEGNVRAIEKILMAYDPDFAFMRPAAFGSVSVEQMFVQIAPQLPTSVLEQVKTALLEERKQKELPEIVQ